MRNRKKRTNQVFHNRVLLALVIIIIVLVSFYEFSHPPATNMNLPPPHRAAIVDQLSLTESNQTLIQACTEILQSAGFTVDYYEPKDVTVDFYRDLPSKGYGLIIFRVHSAGGYGEDPLCLFTSELFDSTKHVAEYLAQQVWCVGTSITEPPFYFGITPKFVRSNMRGNFQNTTILMMTCRALSNIEMSKAFVEKGASICIGWTDLIGAGNNDQATILLLQQFITEKKTVIQAVAQVMNDVRPDSQYNSQLGWYPTEKKDYAILPYD